MPSVPMAMPSVTAMVLNCTGVAPAARTPSRRPGQLAQVEVARRYVGQVCTIGDERLGQVGVAEAGGTQHGARRRPVGTGLDGVAAQGFRCLAHARATTAVSTADCDHRCPITASVSAAVP